MSRESEFIECFMTCETDQARQISIIFKKIREKRHFSQLMMITLTFICNIQSPPFEFENFLCKKWKWMDLNQTLNFEWIIFCYANSKVHKRWRRKFTNLQNPSAVHIWHFIFFFFFFLWRSRTKLLTFHIFFRHH